MPGPHTCWRVFCSLFRSRVWLHVCLEVGPRCPQCAGWGAGAHSQHHPSGSCGRRVLAAATALTPQCPFLPLWSRRAATARGQSQHRISAGTSGLSGARRGSTWSCPPIVTLGGPLPASLLGPSLSFSPSIPIGSCVLPTAPFRDPPAGTVSPCPSEDAYHPCRRRLPRTFLPMLGGDWPLPGPLCSPRCAIDRGEAFAGPSLPAEL